ncbi:hypothetical protein [Cupriavidus sp. CuC1]|uniref:hypothetical protein n=1 Tax=Cupriavidus sp. CuC1 TaxID=3373131 RepID=UPI0037CE1F74
MARKSFDGDHTPAPWKIRTPGSLGTTDLMIAMTYPSEPDERKCKENGRRIIACVNACAGIPTEILEQMWGRPASSE